MNPWWAATAAFFAGMTAGIEFRGWIGRRELRETRPPTKVTIDTFERFSYTDKDA